MPTNALEEFSATQLVRDLAVIRSRAVQNPVAITSHGRAELVLLSADNYAQLSRAPSTFERAVVEAKLDILLDAIDVSVVIIDAELRVRRVNRAMRLTLRLSDDPLRGLPVLDMLPRALAPFLTQRLEEVRASGVAAQFEFPSHLRPGRTIRARLCPWPGGFAYLSQDVSDEIAAFDRAAELDALDNALAASGNRGSGSIGGDGVICRADAGLCRLVGADRAQLCSTRFAALFDLTDRSRVEQALQRDEPTVIEARFLKTGIDLRPARVSLAAYRRIDARQAHAFVLEEL